CREPLLHGDTLSPATASSVPSEPRDQHPLPLQHFARKHRCPDRQGIVLPIPRWRRVVVTFPRSPARKVAPVSRNSEPCMILGGWCAGHLTKPADSANWVKSVLHPSR